MEPYQKMAFTDPGGTAENFPKSGDSCFEEIFTEIAKFPNEKNIDCPKIVFSVIGESQSFVPRPWQTSLFKTALLDAATDAGESWILGKGGDSSVSRMLSETLKEYKCLKSYQQSHTAGSTFLNIKQISFENEGNSTSISMDIRTVNDQDLVNLDVNVDLKEYDEYAHFRVHLDKHLSEKNTSYKFSIGRTKQENRRGFRGIMTPVAVVGILVEGDFNSIKHAYKVVCKSLPLIVVKGTGKAADLIAEYIQSCSEQRGEMLMRSAPLLFGKSFVQKSLKELKTILEELIKKVHLISVFDLSTDKPESLSKLVGEAVVRAWSIHNMELSNDDSSEDCALREDLYGFEHDVETVAKVITSETDFVGESYFRFPVTGKISSPASLPLNFFFEYQIFQEDSFSKRHGETLVLKALMANRCDYIEVLLDQGILIQPDDFPYLYQETLTCKSKDTKTGQCLCIHWILMQEHKKRALDLVKDGDGNYVRNIARCLCMCVIGYKMTEKDFDGKENENNEFYYHGKFQGHGVKRQDKSSDEVIKDLLLWAILSRRMSTAAILWKRTKHQLFTGVVCARLLEKLSRRAANIKEESLSKELMTYSRVFHKRCIDMMDGLIEANEEHALQINKFVVNVWDLKSSPMKFAFDHFMYDIIAHTCTQKYLNKKCYNGLAPDFVPFLKALPRNPCAVLSAPFSMFLYNYLMFALALLALSFMVLRHVDTFNNNHFNAKLCELYVYSWAFGDFIGETGMAVLGFKSKSEHVKRNLPARVKRHFNNFWNVLDVFSFAILIIAVLVKNLKQSETFRTARRFFSLALLLLFLRFLQVFLIHRKLGPILIMMKEMMKDLLYFLIVVSVIILGVGIFYHANLFPNHSALFADGKWYYWRIWKMLYYPFYQMFGEGFHKFLEGRDDEFDCTNNKAEWSSDSSVERCPVKEWIVPVVSAVYMLISNLLIVNLVISMFSHTFAKVKENSEKLWRFERYSIITEYKVRKPSPFNLICLPIQCLRWVSCSCDKEKKTKEGKEEWVTLQNIVAANCD